MPGDPAAVSGPGRGYAIDAGRPAYLLAGDETAIPAISQLLDALPSEMPVQVHVEVACERRDDRPAGAGRRHGGARLPPGGVPGDDPRRRRDCSRHGARHPGVGGGGGGGECSGSAATSSRTGLPRAQASVRGYWKHGRSGDTDGDT